MDNSKLTIVIHANTCRVRVVLPDYFDEMPLQKIRKVFKLMTVEPWRNEETHEKLQQFFPEWEQDFKAKLDSAKTELVAARHNAEAKRQTLAALGSTVDANIEQAKQWLAFAKRHRKHPSQIDEYRAALSKAKQPKTDYAQAVKTVKALEATVKYATAALERSDKVINAYNQINSRYLKEIKSYVSE